MKGRVVLALAVLCVGTFATSARAHDPAEQPLRDGTVFLPFPAQSAEAVRFLDVVAAANHNRFAIRVAIISRSRDLDEYTSYWRRPRAYARLLGGELAPSYAKRVLVVMPNGFGLNPPSQYSYGELATITIGTGNDGLLTAAQLAVERLAASTGVFISAPAKVTTPGQRASHDRLVIVLVSLGALAVAVVLSAWRRKRSPT